MLGMFHAEITSIHPIEERTGYDEADPIYLMGVKLNQTWGELKEEFINKNLFFLDKDGRLLGDDDIVATGRMIVIKDTNGTIIDRVHVVLKGDVSGDGMLNAEDYTLVLYHITNRKPVTKEFMLASLVTDDDVINAEDYTAILYHITGRKYIEY